MAARRLRKVAETSTFNQIAESALKSFYAGNFSEARFKYDVASDYGVSSSVHNSVWLYEKAFQKLHKESKTNALTNKLIFSDVKSSRSSRSVRMPPFVANYLKQASKNKNCAMGGFIGTHERLRRELVTHARRLAHDPSATTNERTWAYLKLGMRYTSTLHGSIEIWQNWHTKKPLRRGKERHNIIKEETMDN